MPELKPCPFCGDIHPTVLATIDGDPIIPCFVLCSFCSARINGPNRHDAIEAWNRRADDAGPVRHAKNVMEDYPSLFQCSACGWSCDDTYCGDSAYRYCPGCGAKMGEEAKEDV